MPNNEKNYIFYQLFEHESSTYTYLIGDPVSKECVLIDPVIETIERDIKAILSVGMWLKSVFVVICGLKIIRQRRKKII